MGHNREEKTGDKGQKNIGKEKSSLHGVSDTTGGPCTSVSFLPPEKKKNFSSTDCSSFLQVLAEEEFNRNGEPF
jgi:hypothetical protein